MRKFSVYSCIAVIVLCALSVMVTAATVTQSITYQGKLTNAAGSPLTGSYSVTFRLYDASTGGTVLSNDTHSVTAANGLFTTTIAVTDPAVVDGRALWLGIKVGTDPEMTPRQEIRPVPYALGLRPGAWITSTDASVALNLQNKGGGKALNISTTGANSVSVYAETFGANSDGVSAWTYGDSGEGVYAHTEGANSNGVLAVTTGINSDGVYAYTSGANSDGVYTYTFGDESEGVYAVTSGVKSKGVYSWTFGDESEGMFAHTEGDNADGVLAWTEGDSSIGVYAETNGDGSTGVNAYTVGANSNGVFASTTGANSNGVSARTKGDYSDGVNVLTWGASSVGVYASSNQSEGVVGKGKNSAGVKGESAQDVGVYGIGKTGGYFTTNQAGTYLPGIPGVNVSTIYNYNPGVRINTSGIDSDGVVASTTGDASDGVYAYTEGVSSNGVYAYTEGGSSHGVYSVTKGDSSVGLGAVAYGDYSGGLSTVTNGDYSTGVSIGTYGINSAGVDVYSYQSYGINAATGRADHKYGVYTPDYIYAKGTQYPSSDVADFMPVRGDAKAGTVLIISDDGQLAPSTTAYDARVAGIISTDPGIFLSTKDDGNKGEALIAIAGRVPCRVDARYSAIHAGDLLTTSDNPGYAMKAIPDIINGHKYYPDGTILGKAMGTLKSGTGTIEVLVTLQ